MSCLQPSLKTSEVLQEPISEKTRLYQVQEREQEDPDDIDKMPIQAGQLDEAFMLSTELPAPGHDEHDGEDHQPAQDVQGVETGHGEVSRCPHIAPRNRVRQVR